MNNMLVVYQVGAMMNYSKCNLCKLNMSTTLGKITHMKMFMELLLF